MRRRFLFHLCGLVNTAMVFAGAGCVTPGPTDALCFWKGSRRPVVYSEHYGHFPTLWQPWPECLAGAPYVPPTYSPASPPPGPVPSLPQELPQPRPVQPMPSPDSLLRPPPVHRGEGDIIRGEAAKPTFLERAIRIRDRREPAKPRGEGAEFYSPAEIEAGRQGPLLQPPPSSHGVPLSTPPRSIRVRPEEEVRQQ